MADGAIDVDVDGLRELGTGLTTLADTLGSALEAVDTIAEGLADLAGALLHRVRHRELAQPAGQEASFRQHEQRADDR